MGIGRIGRDGDRPAAVPVSRKIRIEKMPPEMTERFRFKTLPITP
jgi:hypothetical protein